MADDILKNIPLPADLPENWTSGQIIAPTGAEAGLDEQHGYNYLMKQVNNAQKAAKALNEGKLGLHDTADNGVVASGSNYVRFGDGTQICWGLARDGSIPHNASFPVPFTSEPSITAVRHWGGATGAADNEVWVYDTTLLTGFKIGSNRGIYADWIAIGRWK